MQRPAGTSRSPGHQPTLPELSSAMNPVLRLYPLLSEATTVNALRPAARETRVQGTFCIAWIQGKGFASLVEAERISIHGMTLWYSKQQKRIALEGNCWAS